jgi:hypothetical protein
MAPTTVRLVLIEGENADGVTVEEDNFEVTAAGDPAAPGAAVDQVIAAIVGTREGAVEGGFRLTSTGVTWTDPAGVGALHDELAVRDVGSAMLVSPLLAAAVLAQTVGSSLGYERIAMLFVEPKNATLAVVEVADGSIVELHRQPLEAGQGASLRAVEGAIAAQLATMVAGLDARGPRADGVFLIGCSTDIVSIKPALEAVTSLQVSAPEEPEMALARGAALASANAPLFASSTAALAYALDPGTGELSPGAFSPTYLDVSAHADAGEGALAYSALGDGADDEAEASPRRPSFMLAGSALAAIFAVVAGVLVLSLTSDRPTSALRHNQGASVATPAQVPGQVPVQVPSQPPQAQPPAPSSPPPAPLPEVAAPPPTTANVAPVRPAAPVRRAPAPRAPASVPTPVQQAAPPPVAPPPPPPAAVAAPPPQPAPAAVPTSPPMTMYLHFPFVTVPIPITPPPPPQPPPPPPP